MRDLGQHAGCGFDQLMRRHVRVQGPAHPSDGARVHGLNGYQAVHEEAQSTVRGHASGGGVGTGHQAPVFEVGHDVAHGRGTDREFGGRRQRLGANGVAFGQVVLHEHLEQMLGALTDLRSGGLLALARRRAVAPRTAGFARSRG